MSDITHQGSASCDGSVEAGFMGAGKSLLGLVGLGSFLPGATDDSDAEVQKAQVALSNAQALWSAKLAQAQNNIVQDQLTYIESLQKYAVFQQSNTNEAISEKIQINILLIFMLSILVIFLVLFDIL